MIPLIVWAIAIVLVIVIFMLIKADHVRNKTLWIFIIGAAIVLIIGFIISISGRNIDFNSVNGIKLAGQLYMGWLSNTFNNVKTLTGQAIKMDWRGNENIKTPTPPSQPTQTK